ncbi:tRNA lysidine(34) synthetase TilS [Rhodoferax sp. PAMC 29310]|uniref:tRNA lysidine(34) synthetase TilS n=1 Tax=Rhodoferax sp. PAMC 29310 TaxID=2822760 RepID=UPI001B31EEB6|nr:tRNA lysidine(34) synthetase TilS [Rhodoferax sp. PAMC 29310]
MTVPLASALAAFQPELPLAVAYSGGADSTALLLACAEKWPGQVHAIHIHHGLQSAADEFEANCRLFCTHLAVPLTVKRVNARATAGQSPEDAARRARYGAIQALAFDECAESTIKSIAVAQHADDQVETILLAMSRGSGLPGLSGMAGRWVRNGLTFYRPLLKVGGADIREWLASRSVNFVEDPTNTDESFTRNRIRARLLPVLHATFPQFRDTFTRSAVHIAQAQAILEEVAEQDLVGVGSPPVIKKLQQLSQHRQANVLRHWLAFAFDSVPSAAQLDELQRQIARCVTRGHQIRIKVGAGFVERRGTVLHWYNPRVLL